MNTKPLFLLLLIIIFSIPFVDLNAQEVVKESNLVPATKSVVTKHDGTEFIGIILSQDEREILIETDNIGRVIIPKHEIASIRALSDSDFKDGKFLGENLYATRYFLTTNGLPMRKGDSYALISLFGPEYQAAVADNFTVGAITTWVGIPLIGSAKYAFSLGGNVSAAVGALIGSGSWASISSFGGLAYGSLTYGNNRSNISFTAGYAGVSIEGDKGSAPLYSVAGMGRISDKVAFVFDSFLYTKGDFFGIFIPGLRFYRPNKGAFQFGFGGVYADGELLPVPIPMVSWFVRI